VFRKGRRVETTAGPRAFFRQNSAVLAFVARVASELQEGQIPVFADPVEQAVMSRLAQDVAGDAIIEGARMFRP